MATQQGLYDQVAITLKTSRSTVGANTQLANELAKVYDQVLAECLSGGLWNFALRSTQESSDATPSVLDFTYEFSKPDDFVRLAEISADAGFGNPLQRFAFEGTKFYANDDPVYLKYVSDDVSYGLNLAIWPALYTRFVIKSLAKEIAYTITGSKTAADKIDAEWDEARKKALTIDAMEAPTKRLPAGRLVRSRGRHRSDILYDRKVT